MKASEYVANFDSATAMLRATARYLRGRSFPQLGMMPEWAMPLMQPVASSVNALPEKARERLYVRSGWGEAVPPEKLGDVSAEEISRWMEGQYPRRCYQAATIGSSNGALVHLYCALGIPWLPQTFLVPVRRKVHPDEPRENMEWGREHAHKLLEANPELQLHHMHDANQDRLMIERMTYFRVKRLRLGEAYEQFLEQTLPPGATIFLVECNLRWPTTRISERHVFQHAANYTGRAAKAMPPVYPAEKVAKTIVGCAKRPKREVFVGNSARTINLQHTLAPGLTERSYARMVDSQHLEDQPSPPNPGAAFEPMAGTGVSGGWGGRAKTRTRRHGGVGGRGLCRSDMGLAAG